VDAQIIDDFGEPSFSSYPIYIQHVREDGLEFENEEIWKRSILDITTEEYPWTVRTLLDIESGMATRLK